MKPKPSATPAPARYWRSLALLALAGNAVLALLLWRAGNPPPAAALPPALQSYGALGSFMAENNGMAKLGWSEAQFAAFQRGFRASYEGRGLPLDAEARQLRDETSAKLAALVGPAADPVAAYFQQLREKEGAIRTTSGLHYRITEAGSGPVARADDTVILSFAARLPDGRTVPPLTRERARMKVRDLLPGLAESVQLLSVGGKALVFVPPELAFPPAEWPAQLPANTPIGFFLELHDIVTP